MMTQKLSDRSVQLQTLCDGVRKYAKARDYQKCVTMICKAMGEFPDAPQPHNLLGIVMEKKATTPVPCVTSGRPMHWIPPTCRQGRAFRGGRPADEAAETGHGNLSCQGK